MESPDALLDAITPWLRVLRVSTEIGGFNHGPSETMHVLMHPEVAGGSPTCEALELLALLGGIDYDAWKRAVHMAWPESAQMLIDTSVDRALPLGCEIRIDRREPGPSVDDWLQNIIFPITLGELPGYFELRGRLESAYAFREQDEQSFQPKPIPREQLVVPVWVSMINSEYLGNLRKMMQIMAVQQATSIANAASDEPYKPLLRVKRLSLSFLNDGFLAVEAMLYMVEIVECGGELDRLSVFGVDTSDKVAVLLASSLQALMGCENQSESAPFHPERGRVRAVEVGRLLNRRAVAAVYSALAASRTVERVFLNNPLFSESTFAGTEPSGSEDRRHLWYWISHTFFSTFAAHRITTVHVSVDDVTMQDVAYVDEFLRHPRPLELLFEGETGLKDPTSKALATACRFYLSLPSSNTTDSPPRGHTFARQHVRMLSPSSTDEDPGSVVFESVLLPGYGRAWVKRSDIEERVSSNRLPPQQLQSIVFHDMTDESAPAVLKLLQLVGHDVNTLEFTGVEASKPLDAWLLAIVESCPHLIRLKLHEGILHSLNTVAEAFERRLTCLRELSTHGVQVVDTRHAPAFFLKLAGGDHPMTRSLRKLEMGFEASTGSRQELWDASHEVLRSNYKLRTFELRAYFNAQAQVETEQTLSLYETGKTAIHEQKQPLSLHAKLAFLSVVDGDNAEWPVIRAMDASVLALVFQFAAQCHTRSVVVNFANPADDWEGDEDEEE